MDKRSTSFSTRILKLGINPYVKIPLRVSQAFGRRGYVPVEGTLNGYSILGTLVPTGGGRHRLYINGEVRRKADVDVGDRIRLTLRLDRTPRVATTPQPLLSAFKNNPEAKSTYDRLRPSDRRDILLYLNWLKRPESLERNVKKVIDHLLELGKSNSTQPRAGSVLARPPNWYDQTRRPKRSKSR